MGSDITPQQRKLPFKHVFTNKKRTGSSYSPKGSSMKLLAHAP